MVFERKDGVIFVHDESGTILAEEITELKKLWKVHAVQTHAPTDACSVWSAFVYHYGPADTTAPPVGLKK